MNEVRNIHLGRQAYTVSVDAYKDLQNYLFAIQKRAGEEVAKEVELRMAELLTERHVTVEKVVLQQDIDYLKEQLGTPSDFGDESVEGIELDDAPGSQRRLFRDMDNAMIAGVAAGLAKYFGVSVIVIRLLFVLLTFFGGATVVIYLVLWLLVPEAATNTDRLQMEGKAVNVDNIKRAVERADVPGATRRATHIASGVMVRVAKIGLSVIGSALVAIGVAALLAAAATFAYGVVHGLSAGHQVLFPLGSEQIALLVCAFVLVMLMAVMLMMSGLAVLRNRSVAPVWVIATMVGVFVATGAIGTALGFDSAPAINDRYQSLQHTRHINAQPFTRLHFVGHNVFYISQPGPNSTAGVEIRTLGKVDTSAIKVIEKDGVLTVDSTKYHPRTGCNLICPFGTSNTEIVITNAASESVPSDAMRGTKLVQFTSGGSFQPTDNW